MPDDLPFMAAPHRPEPALAQASAPPAPFTNVLRLRATGSTNALAAEAARGGTEEGLVVVADVQHAGRGRRSRRWVSAPEGALLCSVLFRPPLAAGELWLCSALTALAALGACAELAPAPISIKWPNDLSAPNGKLAGVLAELVEASPPAVVVGIGLNLFWPDGWTPASDASLADLLAGATTLEAVSGRRVERDTLLALFLERLSAGYAALLAPGGADQLIVAYRAACSTIGEEVRIETERATFVGTARGLEASGALRVEVGGELRVVDVGDVVHLRAVDPPPASRPAR